MKSLLQIVKFSVLLCFVVSILILVKQIYAQSSASCATTKVGNPQGPQPPLPPECQGAQTEVSGDAKELAQQILGNSKIKLSTAARGDIQATIDGKPIQNSDSCGKPINLHPALLKLILELAQKHTYFISNIVTSHGCDTANHPKGRAMDVHDADGKNSWQNNEFRQDVVNLLPAGGGLGQQGCPGSANVSPIKNLIRQFVDSCNHSHVDVGTNM